MALSSVVVTWDMLLLKMVSHVKVNSYFGNKKRYKIYNVHTIIDVDECQEGVCSQLCNNSVGGFQCHCYPGFEIAADGRSCRGNQATWVRTVMKGFLGRQRNKFRVVRCFL